MRLNGSTETVQIPRNVLADLVFCSRKSLDLVYLLVGRYPDTVKDFNDSIAKAIRILEKDENKRK